MVVILLIIYTSQQLARGVKSKTNIHTREKGQKEPEDIFNYFQRWKIGHAEIDSGARRKHEGEKVKTGRT